MAVPPGVPPPPAAPPGPGPEPSAVSAWPRSAQLTVGLLLTAAVFYLLGRWTRDEPAVAAPHADARPLLDLNRAGRAELRLLPGLGDSLAERVVEHRRARGPFRSVDDLRQVAGVGPKTLDRLRPWLFVDPAAEPDDAAPEISPPAPAARVSLYPSAAPKGGKKEVTLVAPVAVNRATPAELQKLPGIGPKLAQRIADERTLRGPFRTADELRRVPGIGPKTLEKLRPFVTVDDANPPPPTALSKAGPTYNE